jgi:ATP-dependent Clp protease protease subunit
MGGIGGTATDVRINAQLIMHMKQVLAELTAAQTGKPLEQILKDNDRDSWFTAPEALAYGFIDHVVEKAALAGGGGMSSAN